LANINLDLAGLSVTSVAAPVQTPERENIGTNKDTAVATNTGAARVGDGVATASKSAGGAAATGAAGNNAGGNKNGNGNANSGANAGNGATNGNGKSNGAGNANAGNANAGNGNGRGNNQNQRRGLKWAKRAIYGSA
jgi:hypothetical protein